MVKVEQGMFYKKTGFITLAVIVSLLCIIIGWFVYEQEINESREEAEKDMKAIGELKTKQIADWYKERIDEIEIRTISPYLSSGIEKLLKDSNNRIDREKVYKLLKAHKRETHFDEIMLSSKDGELILATSNEIKEFDTLLVSKIKLAVKNRTIQITDIYFNQYLNKPVIDFLSPIFDEEREVIAVMIFRIDPEDYLYPFLQSWLPTVKTFETLLVRADGDSVVFLNELKFKKNTVLKLKFPMHRQDIPAVKAVSGHKGIFEGNDYRGVPVISCLSHVPGTKWYLVTKINKSELLKDSMGRAVSIILIIALFVIGVILLFIYIYNARQKNIYKKLFEAEQEFETTLYSIGDAVITTDKSGKIKYMNPVAELLTGWAEKEAIGNFIEDVFKIINEETRAKVENPVVKVLREGLVVGLANHTLLISKDGLEIPIADSGAPIKDENGEIIGVVLVFRDQTEERYAQKIMATRLKILEIAQKKSLHDIFQYTLDEIGKLVNSPIGFYHLILPDQETLWLQAWSTRTEQEFCKAEGKGLHYKVSEAGVWVDCIHQRKPVIHNDYESLPHKKGLPEGHAPVIREVVVPIMRNDKIVAVMGVGNKPSLYSQKDMETVNFLADVLWEVAEKKIAEEKLIENEKRNRYISELMSDIAYSCKQNEQLVYEINWMEGAVESITGYTFNELLEMKCWGHIVIEEDFPIFKKHVLEIPAGEEDTRELRIKRKDGEIRWITSKSKCFSDETTGGKHVLYGGIIDITQRKASELAIIESEEKYRKLIEVSPDGIIIHQNGIIKYANQSAAKIGGYDSTDELIGKNAIEFVHPDYREMALRRIRDTIMKGERAVPMEEKFIQKDGSILDVEVTAIPFLLNNETAVQTIIRDISERKKKEAELFEAKDILEKIYLGIKDGIVIIDSKSKNITGCNYAAENIFRYSYNEMLGKHISILLQKNEQINFKEIATKFSTGKDNEFQPVSEILQRKDSMLFPATYTVLPLTDKNNKIIRFVLIVRDMSEEVKKEQERKLVNQRLRVFAEHLQSVREDERTSIAREIHDEIGQALSVMNMNLSIMERDYLKDTEKINIDGIKEEINSMKEFIMKTVEKMRKLIINLRPEVVEDLEITEAIEWLVKEFSKDNKIDCVFNKEVEKIGISKDETMSLFRIAQEALRNVARHSGATKAEVTIRKNNKNYEMIISDNGKGFNVNEVNYKKSFGLTGIRERVEILNGKVDVITELNKGTKIVVKFHKEN
ncbi:PAS domain S-box protein [Bacteroidetes/Chlorobi group bacterium ChocPot_Mid]|nr:MAG: PAS domain S-box protein [Bacteroidetes/Chlorobi group bacterium ChocPot_Mid]